MTAIQIEDQARSPVIKVSSLFIFIFGFISGFGSGFRFIFISYIFKVWPRLENVNNSLYGLIGGLKTYALAPQKDLYGVQDTI